MYASTRYCSTSIATARGRRSLMGPTFVMMIQSQPAFQAIGRANIQAAIIGGITRSTTAMAAVIETLLDAERLYGETKYKQAAIRCGEFILLAQMPAPQRLGAQQYNTDMHPAWARKFEPPAVSSSETAGVIRALLTLHKATGDERFLGADPNGTRVAEGIGVTGRRIFAVLRAALQQAATSPRITSSRTSRTICRRITLSLESTLTLIG